MQSQIRFGACSEKGRRDYNQDSFVARLLGSEVYLFAVADGMGGTFGGERASRTAIAVLQEQVEAQLDALSTGQVRIGAVLELAIQSIQKALNAEMEKDHQLKNMGTTLVVLLVVGQRYGFCNIGDSRLYHYHQEELIQLTQDHSYIEELIKRGNENLSPDFVARHQNVITRVLNGGQDQADFFEEKVLAPKESFLLCSDGLILEKQADTEVLRELLKSTEGLKVGEACDYLVQYAFDQGSSDNITAVLVRSQSESSGDGDLPGSGDDDVNDYKTHKSIRP